MDFTEKDYLEISRSRITWQFKESTNLDTLIKIWLEGYQGIQKTLLDIRLINDVDTAVGEQLDVIGEIVGQPRELINISSTGFFGFLEDAGAKQFGSIKNNAGGFWYSIDDPDSGNLTLFDPLYRIFVRAKIRNNNSGSTPEEIIAATKDLFNVDTVELLEGDPDGASPAVFSLAIGRAWNDSTLTEYPGLDETEIARRLLPKPVGVEIVFADVFITPTLNAVENWVSASDQLYELANVTYPATL